MLDISQFDQINPPARLLMGPGPINADPRVLRAMSSQLIGQYDPAMTGYMNQVMALYRALFRTENRWTMLVDGTSRAGIEALLVSAIRPGDKVLVPVFGRFGHLLCEIARRCRAEVHTIEVPWGEVFSADRIEDAIKRVRPRLLLTVQGDTSTTMLQPLHELGDICRRHGVLFYTDATASFGGNPLETDARGWMRSPPGCRSARAAPPAARRSLSARSLKRLCAAVNAWRRDPHRRARRRRRRDDLLQLFRHRHDHGLLGPERLNHHTEATSMLFAARECARVILKKGWIMPSPATGCTARRCWRASGAWGWRCSAMSSTA